MIRIEVEGAGEPIVYDYEGDGTLTIGRLPSVDLPVTHTDISRVHCEIEPDGDAFLVRDLGSRNGTFLDGEKVDEAMLLPGQTLKLGPTILVRFGDGGGAKAPAPAKRTKAKRPSPPPATPEPSERDASEPEPPKKPSERTPARAPEPAPPAAAAPPAPEAEADADGRGRGRRRRVAARAGRRSATATYIVLAGIAIALAVVAKKAILDPLDREADGRAEASAGPGSASPRPSLGGALDRPGGGEGLARTESPRSEMERQWAQLQAAPERDPTLRAAALEAFAERFAGTDLAQRARIQIRAIREVEAVGGSGTKAAAVAFTREVERLLQAERFREAYFLAEAGPRLRLSDEDTAGRLAAQVSSQAYLAFGAARDRARSLAGGSRPFDAYVALRDVAAEMRGLPFEAEVTSELAATQEAVSRRLASGAPEVIAGAETGDRSELEILVPEAEQALIASDFETALRAYRRVLELPLTPEERLEYQWRLYEVRRIRALFARLLAYLGPERKEGQAPVLVTMTQSWKAEAAQADKERVRLEVIIPGEKSRPVIEKRWKDLTPYMLVELYRGLPLEGEGLLTVAAFAFQLGYEYEAHAALIQAFEEFPAYREEIATLLSRRTGRSVAAKDLVVFEGRLIDAREQGAILAARQAEKDRAKALAEELATAKKEKRGQRVLDEALAMLQRGSFEEGMGLIRQIAEKLAGTETGDLAKKRLEDPFLRRRGLPLDPNDPDAEPKGVFDRNRVSIYFLAEGYQLDDAQQKSFDGVASRAQRILVTAEPWKEYATYFQYYAVNVTSKDRGLDRMPGDVKRDTPFGGAVNDGTYTVQNGLVRSFLTRFEGPKVGVVLGNDNASVATGGGGACAVVKGMVDVCGHEIGHAFASLGDEYDNDPSGQPGPTGRATSPLETSVIASNLIGGNQKDDMRKKAPWAHWIALGPENWTGQPVDLYEGGNRTPFDVWRPQRDCKMRTSSSRFCAVCMEQMIVALYRSVRPIDETSPKDGKAEIAAGEKLVLRVATLKPRSRYLDVDFEIVLVPESEGDTETRDAPKPRKIAWKGTAVADGRAAYVATEAGLKPGRYRASVTVTDPTPWVRQADRSMLTQTHTWDVVVRD